MLLMLEVNGGVGSIGELRVGQWVGGCDVAHRIFNFRICQICGQEIFCQIIGVLVLAVPSAICAHRDFRKIVTMTPELVFHFSPHHLR